MVASIIMGLTVSAVAIMIINASNLRSVNDHNRQARILAQEDLEDPTHHFLNYNLMAGEVGDYNLNPGEGGKKIIPATLNLTVSDPLPTIIDGVSLPSRTVVSTISWVEDGQNLSVSLRKRITRVR